MVKNGQNVQPPPPPNFGSTFKSFVLQPPPLHCPAQKSGVHPAETSQRVQAGLGLGLRVQGQAELGRGGQGVLGWIPNHCVHCSKNFNSATAHNRPF